MSEISEREFILKRLKEAVDKFVFNEKTYLLIPEVRTNIGYALSNAKTINDVAAIPGRLTVAFNRVIYCMLPAFGASDHIARVILSTMKYDKNMRSAINLKYYDTIRNNLDKSNLFIFDRSTEPHEVKNKEGGSMQFMISKAFEALGKVPNYIIDLGDYGKEPSVFVIDKDPIEVVDKSLKLLDYINA
ncbi:phosphomethylpyrimidine kinase [Sulfolobus sp. A20]|uniref:thiamine-phosphate synthase family protein n=1 Tax=Sulfolobaceae TaxID=118883 RepID=UPI0008461C23|nr:MULTISPECIES: thiamine-phosphate synthase family protein [unclassified Sulfolobus]TRM77351.1 phosphomethylpyrimidine kinase [Sulfolobus sp. A20-N-F8]TRM79189.1 phosphomethylpyrimidine kinase [Sulfolobus sp. B5]TRM82968.1 phosphomethylpyrimidine kinase [Sulfolobus sp. F3]TRM86572.1 phosphomethylpyrimidine kinase [Sulfolobus sp. C3]TRM94593.1 phosphomethylpyrimidine kinase [Sulfolobus sp. A20-N-G8]TRN00668.1 phosphomethylpyrimidine kinase [Sulfolobus sp. F1]TRN04229.1 phosphomethylpyrimidin